MKPWERYAEAPDGPWAQYGAAPEKSLATKAGEVVRDVAAGAVRGAGSIGATLLAPIDVAKDAIAGKGLSLESNRQRRAAMDAALGNLGADTDSASYQVGKLAGEVAGTAGAGGLVAGAAAKVAPGLAAAAPGLIEATRTAGMSAAGARGAAGLATRMAGGAIAGAASAGLVNPEDVGSGAAIGAAAPVVVQSAAKAGAAIARTLKGPMQSPEVAAAVKAARDAGYVIPPTQAKPTLANRAIEGLSGKITTAQNASAKNQQITQALSAKALGLPGDTPLTPEVLDAVRSSAGAAYDAVSSAGAIVPSTAYSNSLDKISAQAIRAAEGFPNAAESPVIRMVDSLRSSGFDSSSAVAKIKELRSSADDAFRTGNTDMGRAARAGAKAIEDELERHLQSVGRGDLLKNFRDARSLIAKTYTVQKAMSATGTVDARKLAKELQKGKPLSGELRQAAEFGGRFPKAAQTVEQMGSLPQVSPLDFGGAAGLSALLGDPMALTTMFLRPLARATALSGPVQNNLQQGAPGVLSRIPVTQAAQLGLQAAPVIGSSGR